MQGVRMLLRDQNIILSPLELRHLERSRQWVNDPQIAKAMLRALPVTELEQQEWFELLCTRRDRLVWAVEVDGQHVGNAGYYDIDTLHRRAEFWCLIGEPLAWGKGIGKTTLRLLVKFGFESLGLNKIYLNVDEENASARALYEGAGFKTEGLLVAEKYIEGRFLDVIRMRLLASEWTSAGKSL